MTKSFTSGMLKWGKAVMYLYYNPWVCLSRKTQVAKCISNCYVSSLVKTSISTEISLLRLSPLQIQNTPTFCSENPEHFYYHVIPPNKENTYSYFFLPVSNNSCKSSTTVSETHFENVSLAKILLQNRRRKASQLAWPAVAISSAYHAQECWEARATGRHSPNMVLHLPLSWSCSSKLTQVGYKHGGEFWLKQGFHWEETSAQFGHWFFIKSFFQQTAQIPWNRFFHNP